MELKTLGNIFIVLKYQIILLIFDSLYNNSGKSGLLSQHSNFNNLSSTVTTTTTTSHNKLDNNEPPTKLIKLINGSTILGPMDKDNKMLHSGQLTLSQVCKIKWKNSYIIVFYFCF
jgi:hypothetical protein